MDKIDIVLELVREGKITNDQAKVLLQEDVKPFEPINIPWTQPYNPFAPYNPTVQPYYLQQPYVVTC